MTTTWLVRGERPALVPGAEPRAFAAACREAGLALLRGVDAGWSKPELAAWLLHAYRPVSLRPSPKLELALEADDEANEHNVPADAASSSIVRATAVEELLDLVRVAVSATLAEIREGNTEVVNQALRERRVSYAASSRGGVVWIPLDLPRARLEARVTSLFVADYLFDPRPYERDLQVCEACGGVSFDAQAPCCCVTPLVRSWRATRSPAHVGM